MTVKKTKKMREVEARFGDSIENVIREFYISKNKTLEELAGLFGVNISTVWLWMLKLGIPTRQWHLPEEAEAKGGKEAGIDGR